MNINIKTKEISFCNKQASNVVNTENKAHILDNLKDTYDITISDRKAIMINDRVLNNLERNPHLLLVKSSGTNYFLYMTRINNINYCFYIDRKIKQGYSYPRIISVNYRFSNIIFEDTLLEGELVKDIFGKWQFLIGDLLIYKGIKQKDVNISTRFNNLHSMITNNYVSDNNLDICPLFIKRLFKYSEFKYIFDEFIPNLPYNSRGLYFYTFNIKHSNYLCLFKNTIQTSIKKPDIENVVLEKYSQKELPILENDSIIFGVKNTITPDIYDLYCIKDEIKCKFGVAHISTLRTSKKLRKLFNNISDIINMECVYYPKFKKWEPKEISDKTMTNYESISQFC